MDPSTASTTDSRTRFVVLTPAYPGVAQLVFLFETFVDAMETCIDMRLNGAEIIDQVTKETTIVKCGGRNPARIPSTYKRQPKE